MKAEIHTTLDGDLLRKARRMARERKVAVSAILERALDRYLDQLAGEHIDQEDTSDGDKKNAPPVAGTFRGGVRRRGLPGGPGRTSTPDTGLVAVWSPQVTCIEEAGFWTLWHAPISRPRQFPRPQTQTSGRSAKNAWPL